MLDTVILYIPLTLFTIKRPELFNPPVNLGYAPSFYRKFTSNPTAAQKKAGIYMPRLTIYQRGRDIWLKIEFSAPKLLFNNNLIELAEALFDEAVEALRVKVLEMGIAVSVEVLKQAQVASFHPAKNFPFFDGYSAIGIIKEFSKINPTEKMDFASVKYRNGGHIIQLYSKSHSLVFYDKNKDLIKPESRAFDADQREQQMSLFDYLNNKTRPEILRMEARLSEKPKMNWVLDKLGFKQNPTFSDIFKKDVNQKILQFYFGTYITPSLFIFDMTTSPQKLLTKIIKNDKKAKPKQAIYLTGLQVLSQDKGVKELRHIIEARWSKRTWQRIAANIPDLNALTDLDQTHGFIKDIVEQLEKFEPFRLAEAKPKPAIRKNPFRYH